MEGKIICMRELHTTAVVDERGELSVTISTDLAPGEHLLTLLVDEQPITDNSQSLAQRTRQQFSAFLQDWETEEMSEYDKL